MHYKIDTAPVAPRGRSTARWARIGGRLPWRIIAAALLALFLVGAGIGGYLIGKSPDVDLDAVRSTAATEGREAGSVRGAKEGYTHGYEAARKRTYAAAYSAAYREAYAAEFESVGLDPPERIRVRGTP
jgi:cystathionine beta-lyase family protein involved in aluminum resistance